jgi:rubrerythrin
MTTAATGSTSKAPAGLSAANAHLYRQLLEHVESEGELIGEYERLVGSASPYVSFLAGLIAEDERRHHGLYEEWIESLETIAELQYAGLPPVLSSHEASDLVTTTERLLEFERNDSTELEAMAKRLHGLKDQTLWELVLEVMRMDTEKHIRILEFINANAKASLAG